MKNSQTTTRKSIKQHRDLLLDQQYRGRAEPMTKKQKMWEEALYLQEQEEKDMMNGDD